MRRWECYVLAWGGSTGSSPKLRIAAWLCSKEAHYPSRTTEIPIVSREHAVRKQGCGFVLWAEL